MPSIFGTEPDYRRLLTVFEGGIPDRVPSYEFIADGDIQSRAIGHIDSEPVLPYGEDEDLNIHIRNQYLLGYDYLHTWSCPYFGEFGIEATVDSMGNDRHFLMHEKNAITTLKDLETHPWPTMESVSFYKLEYFAKNLPEGMKLVASIGSGILEWGMWLTGSDTFCLLIYDDPELVRELLDRINQLQVQLAKEVASHPDVIAVIMGDDFGFKTQTFISPNDMRELILPGHKRVADAVHSEGKQYLLHSCGNVDLVMDDLIDYCKIDAKHSFEDAITPVTEMKKRWGDRVALLGGVDIDLLASATPDAVRKRTREILEVCSVGGGYASGSGNSISNYILPENLFAMLDETNRWNG